MSDGPERVTSPREHLAVLQSILDRLDSVEIGQAIARRTKAESDPECAEHERESRRRRVEILVAQRDTVRWAIASVRVALANRARRPTIDEITDRIYAERYDVKTRDDDGLAIEGLLRDKVREISARAIELYRGVGRKEGA